MPNSFTGKIIYQQPDLLNSTWEKYRSNLTIQSTLKHTQK